MTLFSLLAAWAVLGFLQEGGWWKLPGCVVFVLELAGNYEAAAESLRVESISGPRKRDLERVEKKLKELKPGS